MVNAAPFGCLSGHSPRLGAERKPGLRLWGTENKFYRYETFCIFASSNIYKTYNNEK